jgi:dienelactone hydrolase
MKTFRFFSTYLLIVAIFFVSCNDSKTSKDKEPKMKEENITYTLDSVTMNGFVVYDENNDQERPAVLVVHEWWGLNDYDKMRARELARLGYIAMAIDMYGNGKTADNPKDAGNLAAPFYTNPQMAKNRLDAAIAKLKTYSQVDAGKMAAIGYCFGGGVLINSARLGEDLKGVVSFHGSLVGTPPIKELLKANVLVCHGAEDKFVLSSEVQQFKKQMDSIGAAYTFKEYAGATHSFTNPNSTAIGQKFQLPIAYNAAADTASWNDMKEFFGRIFK